MDLRQVSVIGSGTMGRGIAWICAIHGYQTVLNDVEQKFLDAAREQIGNLAARAVEKGRLEPDAAAEAQERIRYVESLEAAVAEADLIIEAVPEDLTLKKDLFSQMDVICGEHTVLASNTSSISITELAGAVERRDQFIGLHFFNPVHVMKLLEIVVGERTSQTTVELAQSFARSLEKEPIVVKDVPGFATSRLGIALGLEAMRMYEDGVASAEDIDRAMELGYNHPMGPLRLTDLVGLDVRLKIADYLAKELGPRFEPPEILRRMVAEGRLGKKAGRGFHDWS